MARVLLLHNPAAHSAPGPALLLRIARELRFAGFAVDAEASLRPGDITRLCSRAAGEGFDRVVVCGGDGSVREAAEGLAREPVSLGLIPLGTANVLARELGVPVRSPLLCASVAGRGEVRSVGLGSVEGQGIFTFCASAGLDSLAVASVDLRIKTQTGAWAYIYSALQTALYADLPVLRVEASDGTRLVASQVFATRIRRYGAGFLFLSKSASLYHPTMRLLAVSPPFSPHLPAVLMRMFRGGLEGAPNVTALEVEAFRLESDRPVPVQADGDLLGTTPCAFVSMPSSLNVVVPRG